jgi:hypothetical protein
MSTDQRSTSPAGLRAATVLGAAWGAALLIRPDRVLRATGADPGLPGVVVAARVLGARQLCQAVLLAARPVPTARWAAAIDGGHMCSMLALAVLAPGYRRPALASAQVAAGLAAITAGAGLRRRG